MKLTPQRGGIIISLTFILAIILTIFPVPGWAEELRPHWLALTAIYWAMALPQRVSVGVGWILGLLLDVLYDALLGQHALALALILYFTSRLHQRVRVFPIWQQAIVVFVFILIYSLIILWIKGLTGTAPNLWLFILPSITSALVWPAVFLFLRRLRRTYQVS